MSISQYFKMISYEMLLFSQKDAQKQFDTTITPSLD